MSKERPTWLKPTREFCRSAGIEVCAWGADTLVVKTESRYHAEQAASQLKPLGFEPIEDEDDANAGLLSLSRIPTAATRAKQQCDQPSIIDIYRPPRSDRIGAAALASFGIWVIVYALMSSSSRSPRGSFILAGMGVVMILLGVDTGLLWRLQINSAELVIRRWFLWSAVPWPQIRSVEVGASSRARRSVKLVLASGGTMKLGTFPGSFACALRDGLQEEIKKRLA